MQDQIFQLQYAMDTFYFLVCGALVMWMAAGFAMLEAGLVRTKKHDRNTHQKRRAILDFLHHVSRGGVQYYVRWRNLPNGDRRRRYSR